ncbi:MAG: hypothetical protein ABJN14_05240 [Paracoccaceae bacterium]
MQVAWMRGSGTPKLTAAQWHSVVAQADEIGFRQVHLTGLDDEALAAMPRLSQLRVGLDIAGFRQQAPRTLVSHIRQAYDAVDGRLVLGLTTGASPQMRATTQMFETVTSSAAPHMLPSDFPMAAPRPEVMVIPQNATSPCVALAAKNGFHMLSPAWQTRRELSRHWPSIVASATHANRRACPSQWHVARYVFVSEDRAAIAAYRSKVAQDYLGPAGVDPFLAEHRVIAGSATQVTEQITQLRTRIGPFGTLHIVDPGLEPHEGCRQRNRFASMVLPHLTRDDAPVIQKALERT